MVHPFWPLFDLVVRTPRLELRYPTDDHLSELAAVASRGIHAPGWLPFSVPWSEAPSPELERNLLKFHWRHRSGWEPDDWSFNPVVLVDGAVVGSQGMGARHFAVLRTVTTGSWLGRDHQGQGIGKEMRAAILHLAFAGLDALEARSGYWQDNEASRRVSKSLGYEPHGDAWKVRNGVRDLERHVRLTREAWEARRRDDIEIEGLDACRDWFVAPS